MPIFDFVTRSAFAIAGVALMLLACALLYYAGVQVLSAYYTPEVDVGSVLLEAVGYTIIAIAVFDVGKYLLEEEAIRAREMRQAGEARRSMTKFISTIIIAVFLEALVAVFEASKSDDVSTMVFPTFLLLAGVGLLMGLGVYQRLSAKVEHEIAKHGVDEGEEEPSPAEAKMRGLKG